MDSERLWAQLQASGRRLGTVREGLGVAEGTKSVREERRRVVVSCKPLLGTVTLESVNTPLVYVTLAVSPLHQTL